MTRLAMTRGDTASWTITLTDTDTGDPIDLTNMGITFTARRTVEEGALDADGVWGLVSHELEIVKTVGSGIELDADPSTGVLTLTIDPADTEDWTETEIIGPFEWDLQVVSDTDERTPLRGVLVISADTTVPVAS